MSTRDPGGEPATTDHDPVRARTARARVVASGPTGAQDRLDRVATEEPMEIRVGGPGQEPQSLVVTMRTPGDDFDLAAGFLASEGLVTQRDEIETIAYCLNGDGTQEYNVVTVRLRRPWDPGLPARHFTSSSSCGICGKATLDQVELHCAPIPHADGPLTTRTAVLALPERMRAAQRVFDETGGLHAAALFDAGAGGELVTLREDVGRHNALDKVIGAAFLAGAFPLAGRIVMVSGRVSFEIVQKAAVAGVPVICAVSAPSSLALRGAERFGVTVLGFLRGGEFNVYTHPERVDLEV